MTPHQSSLSSSTFSCFQCLLRIQRPSVPVALISHPSVVSTVSFSCFSTHSKKSLINSVRTLGSAFSTGGKWGQVHFLHESRDKWDQINGFVFISTRGRCLAQKVSARDRGTCGQVSWIETKGTTDKRGIIGPDPFSIFRLFHVEVGGARPVDLRHLTRVMDAIAGYQYPTPPIFIIYVMFFM